jgi:cell division protein FtsI (penicillin-binding protein 3)
VTLLQLARAYTIFANDGELKPITMLKREEPEAGKQVIAPRIAHSVRNMLEMAVQPGGTAPRAQVAGYRVAGKTGTAHKLEGGRYAPTKYVSSFVGFAPVSDPRIIVAVMIDEPSAGQYYGGLVAAPVFREVTAGTLRTLGVMPDAPTLNVKLPPADTPELKEGVWIARDDGEPKG